MEFLTEFPLSISGKLDRKALPKPQQQHADGEFIAPRTPVEQLIAGIFSDVLGCQCDVVGVNDDFFSLGGNSLQATKIVGRISSAFSTQMGVREFFATGTVATIAEWIGQENYLCSGPKLEKRKENVVDILLSPEQQRMWFLNQFDPQSPQYNIPFALHMEGNLDVVSLNLAITDILQRHEVLRTIFPASVDGPRQQVRQVKELNFSLEPIDANDDEVKNLTEAFASRGIDVTTDIPIQARLYRLAEDRYCLAVVLHHIAADGASLAPFAADLIEAYSARTSGAEPEWEPLPVQFADYSVWKNELLGSPEDPSSLISSQLNYWQERLAGLTDEIYLPFDRQRPVEPSYSAASVLVKLDHDSYHEITKVAQNQHVTPFMVMHAALVTTLSRISGSRDIAVGTAIGGRTNPMLEALVGMFTGTLLLRTDIDGAQTFAQLLAEVRKGDLAAFEHADVPFEQIVDRLSSRHSSSRPPLFQVMFTLDEPVPSRLALPGLKTSVSEIETYTAKFDLHVGIATEFSDSGQARGLSCVFTYATDLFNADTVQSIADRFQVVLESVVSDPQVRIRDIEILSIAEKLVLYPARGPKSMPAELLPQLFAETVSSYPNNIAISFLGKKLTYADLEEHSNILARNLIRFGAGVERVIGIGLPRSINEIIALWAVIKTGAAFVPIDPGYPEDRIAYMLKDSNAMFVLSDQNSASAFTNFETEVVLLDDPNCFINNNLKDSSRIQLEERNGLVHTDSCAYVIYTSGSTGRPKAVQVTHRGIRNLAAEERDRLCVTEKSLVLHGASPSFDAAFFEILMAHATGAALVIAPPEIIGGEELTQLLVDNRVSHAFFAPAVLATVNENADLSLEAVLVAGDVCPPTLVQKWSRKLRLVNAYGPTETTVMATISAELAVGKQVDIGGPVRGFEIFVLDHNLSAVPIGSIGELYLAGPGLARGYGNQTGTTASRFIAALTGSPGQRMYRTGDVVRWTSTNQLEFLGRSDQQVKVRGIRIELGEIDEAFIELESVESAVTIGHKQNNKETALTTYVVSTPENRAEIEPTKLLAKIAEKLPQYMVPSYVVILDEMPLSSAGKIDRKALPEPGLSVLEEEFHDAENEQEKIIVKIFSDILNYEKISTTSSFFSLGGNSLSATQVVARIGEAFGQQVQVRTFFENPTVKELAAVLASQQAISAQPLLVSRTSVDKIPLSYAQQRIWFLNRFDPHSPSYNIPLALRLRGRIDYEAMKQALGAVIERHEILRTIFPDAPDGPFQQVLSPEELELEFTIITEADSEDKVHTALLNFASRGFDVTKQIPIRSALLPVVDSGEDYVLMLVLHHIAADGWSMGPLAHDIITSYTALVSGQSGHLEPLPIQYGDYALWQRKWLGELDDTQSVAAAQIKFWRSELHGAPEQLELPTDFPRPVVQSMRGETVEFNLSSDLFTKLKVYAQQENVTEFMVLHAGLAALLAKITANEDITIGTATAGRGSSQLDGLVGMFVNTVVLRTLLGSSVTFAELVQQCRERDLLAFDNSDTPFERVVEAVNPARSTARHPLFGVSLIVQNAQGFADLIDSPILLDGMEISGEWIDVGYTKTDLEFILSPGSSDQVGLNGRLIYATDLFKTSTAQAICKQFIALLEQGLSDPTVAVGDIDLLGVSGRELVVKRWNNTFHEIDKLNLVQLFERQARLSPDLIALSVGEQKITYAEFSAQVNQLARKLIDDGVGPEVVVAIGMKRSIDLLRGIYAILTAGGAYLPLDPSHPESRINQILEAASPQLVLSTSADNFRPQGQKVLLIDEIDISALSSLAVTDSDRISQIRPENTAYIIFTSGSTGLPKGVAVSHAGISNRLQWMQTTYPINSEDTVLQKTPVTFDVSVWELFWPLQVGARLAIAQPDSHLDQKSITTEILKYQVTTIHFVPSVLAAFLAEDSAVQCTSLRQVFASGEALTSNVVSLWHQRHSAELHNLYGPTEASVDVTAYQTNQIANIRIPIGMPVWNTEVFVLDSRLNPVPIGVSGELYLSGMQLARGYLSRPSLTADRFIANPLSGVSSRMYRTGDLVRWVIGDHGPNLEYLGRTDFQVKVRGLRIELGDIEAAISQHPQVAQSAVIVHGSDADAVIVAYFARNISEREQLALGTDELRDFVAGQLPRYMVPATFIELDSFPLNANGKLDRKLLPTPTLSIVAEYNAPESLAEQLIADIFSSTLGMELASVTANFFDLGGNSLNATKVVSRISAAFEVDLSVRTIFDAPTVRALAAIIESSQLAGSPRLALRALPRPNRIPLSPSQTRMWFLNQYDVKSTTYLMPLIVRLSGEVNVDELSEAVSDVLTRHEALRTRYPSDEQGPYQQIEDISTFYPGLVVEDIPSEWEKTILSQSAIGFDVSQQVPVRVKIFKLDAQEYVLAIVLHHICADGLSLRPFVQDLFTAYISRLQDQAAPQWESLEIQYPDYAIWQQAVLGDESEKSSIAAQQISYWTRQLSGLSGPLELPLDRPRPPVPSNRGESLTFTISQALIEKILLDARKSGVTRFMVLHTALAAALARLSDSTDIAIGSPIGGRQHPALEELVGMFVNTLVLRTQVQVGTTLVELMRLCRDTDLGAFAHADLPFERLVDALAPERVQSHSPLFQVMLTSANFGDKLSQSLELPGLKCEILPEPTNISRFDLQLTVANETSELSESISAQLNFSTDLFDTKTAERIIASFLTMLKTLADDPTRAISEVDLLGEEDRRLLLNSGSGSSIAIPTDSLADLFIRQVQKSPEHIAVVEVDSLGETTATLTYRDFAHRVIELTRVLIKNGIGIESVVAIGMRRSLDQLTAIYASVLAGAAYLPLDPDHPIERTIYVLETAKPKIVLTREADGQWLPDYISKIDIADNQNFSEIAVENIEQDINLGSLRLPHVQNMAYLLFTSGSTGKPKGVAISHEAIVNRLIWMQQQYPLSAEDVVVQKTPTTFDVSVWELFWPLQVGASLVIAAPGGHQDPRYLTDLVRKYAVTTAHFVPSMLTVFIEELKEKECTSLTQVFASGEGLPVETARRFHEKLSAKLHNLYGPTEAAVDITAHQVTAEDLLSVPIGKPVWNSQVYILDSRLKLVPPGVRGELYLSGVQLARGYFGRSELTSDRFVADPFSPVPGMRMYRTGDLVRWSAQCELEYLGRSDFQVKLRGLRIELGEIETVLSRYSGVTNSAATVRDDGPAGQYLSAYVLCEGNKLDTEDIKLFVSQHVPSYMVPEFVTILDEFPLSANGKLDRKSLPTPIFKKTTYRAPSSEIEIKLSKIISEMLNLDRVGVDDSFFALGGDSILSIQLVSRARAQGIALTAKQIFEYRTVCELAKYAGETENTVLPAELEGAGVGLVPVTPVMQWMQQRSPGLPRVCQSLLLGLPEGIDFTGISKTIQEVVSKHDMLRAIWRDENTLEVQDYVDIEPFIHKVSALAEIDDSFINEALNEAANRLNPTDGTVTQFVWISDETGSDYLLIVLHHLVVDAVSWRILIPDFVLAWSAIRQGEKPLLDKVNTSFRRWAHELAENIPDLVLSAEAEYWKSVISSPGTPLGKRPLNPQVDLASVVRVTTVSASSDITDGLVSDVNRIFGLTFNESLIATLVLAVNAWKVARGLDQSATVITIEGHGRDDDVLPGADLSRTVGWFTSVYPARLDPGSSSIDENSWDETTVGNISKILKEQLRAIPRSGIGFGQLQYMQSPPLSSSYDVTPEILFNYLGKISAENFSEEIVNLGWLPEPRFTHISGTADPNMAVPALDINASITSLDKNTELLKIRLGFPTTLFTKAEIDNLGQLWLNALSKLVSAARHSSRVQKTASDFDLIRMEQENFEKLQKHYPTLVDVWPLTPLQQGFVYHSMIAGASADVYTVQLKIDLAGEVDSRRMRKAAQILLDRNPNLRTAYSQLSGTSTSVVIGDVEVQWQEISVIGQQDVENILHEKRREGFDLTSPHLINFALVEYGRSLFSLIITGHHIILDGWSMPLLTRELLTYYALNGDITKLENSASFSAFLRWLQEQDYQETLRQWTNYFSGSPQPTIIAPNVLEKVVEEINSQSLRWVISDEASKSLTRFTQDHSITINTVLQTVWGLVLSSWTGSDDIVFGSTVSGRQAQVDGIENMLGLFINTIPVRIQIDRTKTLYELLVKNQHHQVELLDHHHVSLADVQNKVGLGTLFDTLTVLESFPVDSPELLASTDIDGISVTDITGTDATHYPLTLAVSINNESKLEFHLRYRSDVFDAEIANRIRNRVDQLFAIVAESESIVLHQLDIASKQERQQLHQWSSGVSSTVERLLPDILSSSISVGTAIAVIDGAVSLSYADLDKQSNKLARFLIDLGAGPERTVALALPRGLNMIVAMWAVIRTGAAFVPIDPYYPVERIAHMLSDSHADLGITSSEYNSKLPNLLQWISVDSSEVVVKLSTLSDEILNDSDRNRPLRADNIAYTIYTSGTTGTPKGVQLSHRGVANISRELTESLFIKTDSRVLQVSSPSFDASIFEFLMAFGSGATMVIAPPQAYAGAELESVIETHEVTHAIITPPVLATLNQLRVPTLATLVVGGDKCAQELIEQWAPSRLMANAYGPTEVTIMGTMKAGLQPQVSVTIGTPIRGFTAQVLDRWLQPVPVGSPGELYLSSIALARGYGGLGALTASRFVADPLSPQNRMYRTGDLVRWNANGELEYLGRTDFQVKIRGLRIETAEIESVLASHRSVHQAVVIARKDGPREDYLTAYVTGLVGQPLPQEGAIAAHIQNLLPEYMLPAKIVILEELPLTPVGKLDREALPVPTWESPELLGGLGRVAITATERELSRIFSELLGAEVIDVEESFFALGGDSILSIQLVSRAKDVGITLTPRDIFEKKTIVALAELADQEIDKTEKFTLPELAGGAVGEAPLTPVAQWIVDRGGALGRFVQAVMLALPASAERTHLDLVIQAVINHHDGLRAKVDRDTRTLHILESGEVVAGILVDEIFTELEWSSSSFVRLAKQSLDYAASKLNPDEGKMLRFVWFRNIESSDSRLLVIANHFVIDGVSWRLLIPDFAIASAQISNGLPINLSPVATSYRRWSTALYEAAHEKVTVNQIDYWSKILDRKDPTLGARRLDKSVDFMPTVRHIQSEIPLQVTEALLTKLPARYNASASDGLVAALVLALAMWRRNRGLSHPEALLTLEGHGRDENLIPGADLTRTVGWFTTMFPVHLHLFDDDLQIDLDEAMLGGMATGQVLKLIKEQLRSVPEQGTRYGLLRHMNSSTAGVLSEFSDPQVSFNYLGRTSVGEVPEGLSGTGFLPAPESFDLNVGLDPDMPATAELTLNIAAVPREGGHCFSAVWSFPQAVFNDNDVAELAGLWSQALHALNSHITELGRSGFTPSDIDLVPVTQKEINNWETQYHNISDIWPLMPLQSGLLFHAMLVQENETDIYAVRLALIIEGDLDIERMRQAAQALIDRHPNLRTAYPEGKSEVQLVIDNIVVPWVYKEQPDDCLRLQLAQPFTMNKPPLVRFLLEKLTTQKYRLNIVFHHVLVDGWSMPLLMKDLLGLYATKADSSLLPRVYPYRSFVEWTVKKDIEESLLVWSEVFSGREDAALVASEDRSRANNIFSSEKLELSSSITERLLTICRSEAVTLNTIVQWAWATVLSGILGTGDVVFGTTVSGRPPEIPGVESIIGLFINTLPVRVKLFPADTFRQSITRLQEQQTNLLDHQHVPLADISKSIGAGALFDTLTVFESYPMDTDELAAVGDIDGIRIVDVEATDGSHYPLTLTATQRGLDALTVELKYLGDVFDSDQVHLFLDRLNLVLTLLAENPDMPNSSIQLLTKQELDLLTVIGNSGAPTLAKAKLADLLAAAVEINAEGIALTDGVSEVSYRELDERSNQIARLLISEGVGSGDVIVLSFSRSIESVIALWSVTKTGATFVPVDPLYPTDRIAHMISDSKASKGLALQSSVHKLPTGIEWIVFDNLKLTGKVAVQSHARLHDNELLRPVYVSQPAYMIYTSGSTGKPKGVVIPHSGLSNLAAAQRDNYQVEKQSRVLHFASPSFDASMLELLLSVGASATMVIAPTTIYGGVELATFLSELDVTHAFITPGALGSMNPQELPVLKVIAIGGESWAPELVGRWSSGRRMLNVYGPTETTIVTTMSEAMSPHLPITIGKPIIGSVVYVLDHAMRPVPRGVIGDLHIAGPGLALGYQDRPGLTSSTFVANPFAMNAFGGSNSRMYRTGDRVRWTAFGPMEIVYAGRSDQQVKIRGFRIELGEIDAVFMRHPSVDFSVTKVISEGTDRLVSYLVGKNDEKLDTRVIRDYARDFLAAYMIPSAVVLIDRVPLTPSGKIDTENLPLPDWSAQISDYVEPVTDTQRMIEGIFIEILGQKCIGLHGNFFDLGGNSLLATRLIGEANKAFAISLGVRELFDAPSVELLASRVEEELNNTDVSAGATTRLRRGVRLDRIPLSWQQHKFWSDDQDESDVLRRRMNLALYLRFQGKFDVVAIELAIKDIINRHEVVRTRYPQDEHGPFQVIIPTEQALPELPSADISEQDLMSELQRMASELFDLEKNIALRVKLFRLGDDDYVLGLVTQHISADGASSGPLLTDLMTAYIARSNGQEPEWAPLEIQYADYAQWVWEVNGDVSEPTSRAAGLLSKWLEELRGIPKVIELNSDRPRPNKPSYQAGSFDCTIDTKTHEELVDLALRKQSSLFIVMHAALAAVLSRVGITKDIVIRTPHSGREDPAVQNMIGNFSTPLFLRTRVDTAQSLNDFLEDVRSVDLQAFSCWDVPFRPLQDALEPVLPTAYRPVTQVMFNMLNFVMPELELPGLQISGGQIGNGTMPYDLNISVTIFSSTDGRPAGLKIKFDYATDLFDESRISLLIQDYVEMLKTCVAAPETAIGLVELLSDRYEE
ncbi:MAG: non-ribosomal peptide synthase/polyketide synthase [Mycobacteriaceae bacterium]